LFTAKDLQDSGKWKLNQIYRCKICSALNPYFGFGNLGWAAMHDKLVHSKDLSQSRIELYYKEMKDQDILKATL